MSAQNYFYTKSEQTFLILVQSVMFDSELDGTRSPSTTCFMLASITVLTDNGPTRTTKSELLVSETPNLRSASVI